jgi:hypothetical protein
MPKKEDVFNGTVPTTFSIFKFNLNRKVRNENDNIKFICALIEK